MLGEVIILSIDKFDSIKCQRSWNYFKYNIFSSIY